MPLFLTAGKVDALAETFTKIIEFHVTRFQFLSMKVMKLKKFILAQCFDILGDFPPTGALSTPFLINKMGWLRNKLEQSQVVTYDRKEQILGVINYLFSIYDDKALATINNKDILKNKITVLLWKRNTIRDALKSLHIPMNTSAYNQYMAFYVTCLSEIYRVRAFFMNRKLFDYPASFLI